MMKRMHRLHFTAVAILALLVTCSAAFAQGEWTSNTPVPFPFGREGACIAGSGVLGNSIYVTGGIHPFGVFHNDTFRYDIDTDTWTIDTPKPTATAETTGVSHGGQIFVIGGGFFGAGAGAVGTINESFRPTPP